MSSTTRRTATQPSRKAGAIVRGLPGAPAPAAAPTVELDVRPAYDFVISLFGEHDLEPLPADLEWLHAARESLSAGVRRDLRLSFGGDGEKGFGAALVPLICTRPEVRTAADVVAMAADIEPAGLVEPFCHELDAEVVALLERAIAGDRDQLPAALARVEEPEVREALRRFVDDPAAYRRALLRVLRAWRERFDGVQARVSGFVEREASIRRPELATLAPFDFIERATGGLRWTATPRIRRIVMAPSYFVRPFNYVFDGPDWRLVSFPVSDAALEADATAVPAATLRLFRALGDDSRLRILRHLADGDLYLTEIAERMSLSKPTVAHHLAQLRAAGLVTISESGGMTYYSLRRERLTDAGDGLRRYLGLPPG